MPERELGGAKQTSSRRWLVVAVCVALSGAVLFFAFRWFQVGYGVFTAASVLTQTPGEVSFREYENLAAEFSRGEIWSLITSSDSMIWTPDAGLTRRLAKVLLMGTGIYPDEVDAVLRMIREGDLGTRYGALLLASVWAHDNDLEVRQRLLAMLDSDPEDVTIALWALPVLTGVWLEESVKVPVDVDAVDLSGDKDLQRVFSAARSEQVTRWKTLLTGTDSPAWRREILRPGISTALNSQAFPGEETDQEKRKRVEARVEAILPEQGSVDGLELIRLHRVPVHR